MKNDDFIWKLETDQESIARYALMRYRRDWPLMWELIGNLYRAFEMGRKYEIDKADNDVFASLGWNK